MRILVLGAGGIIGQHLRLTQPEGVAAIYTRRTQDAMHVGWDAEKGRFTDFVDRSARYFPELKPDAIINLAGENRPDVVERNPSRHRAINVQVPALLSAWCETHGAHLVQVSTQGVFGGVPSNPTKTPGFAEHFSGPFGPDSPRVPINAYGAQKLTAETEVMAAGRHWTIVRPTFVLGVRPMPAVGRQNPVEQMLSPVPTIVAESESPAVQRQVCDRWFSVAFAWDVARELWAIAMGEPQRKAVHIGIPYRTNRHVLASYLRPDITIEAVSHDSFEGLAPRPIDTAYAGEGAFAEIAEGLDRCKEEYCQRERMTIEQRAKEISIFLGKDHSFCLDRLKKGFGPLHNAVTEDWNRSNPQTDDEILEWYRTTESYIWELSAYHLDSGFNYSGMIGGISAALKAKGVKRVLCLGDGIGDLTLRLAQDGFDAWYHDLAASRTASFAQARFRMYLEKGVMILTTAGWAPGIGEIGFDAIVSLDFLEHVTSVEDWVRAIYAALNPGGWLVAQNAFAMGSGPDGAMPMHLARNDRFERDWDPLLGEVGFVQEASNWYRRKV